MSRTSRRLRYGIWIACGAVLFVTACSSPAPRYSSRPPAVDVSRVAEPVPWDEPLAEKGNHSPYRVHGKTYTVMHTSQGYHERGIASWYGKKFHGRPTSTMETYDMYKFTAAHKSLPLPTFAEVTNVANGKSVVVRINDRGPFKDDRIIDLSYAAASRLGIVQQGTALVDVRALSSDPGNSVVSRTPLPEPPPPAPPETLDVEVAPQEMFLQIGAFSDLANAWMIVDQLHAAGLEGVRLHSDSSGERLVHKVRIGPVENDARASQLEGTVRQMGLGTPRAVFH